MRCSKCNAPLPGSASFCPECGQKTAPENTAVASVQHRCKSCNAVMSFDAASQIFTCPYCGSQEQPVEAEGISIARIQSRTYRDVELEKQKNQRELELLRMENDAAKERRREEREDTAAYKKGKLSKWTLVFAVISLLFIFLGFRQRHILAGLAAILQTGAFSVSWLMGMRLLPEKKQGLHTVLAVAGFVLIVPVLFLFFNFTYSPRPRSTGQPAAAVSTAAPTAARTPSPRTPTPQPAEETDSAEPSPAAQDETEETSGSTETQTASEETDEAPAAAAPGGVTPEFKEAMDSYEAFFDEYVEFMKSYDSAAGDMTAMLKYLDMLSQYSEMADKLDELEDSEMSDADAAYYIEVTARIYQKLASVS